MATGAALPKSRFRVQKSKAKEHDNVVFCDSCQNVIVQQINMAAYWNS